MDPKCLLTSTDLQTRRARCQHQLSFLLLICHGETFDGWGWANRAFYCSSTLSSIIAYSSTRQGVRRTAERRSPKCRLRCEKQFIDGRRTAKVKSSFVVFARNTSTLHWHVSEIKIVTRERNYVTNCYKVVVTRLRLVPAEALDRRRHHSRVDPQLRIELN